MPENNNSSSNNGDPAIKLFGKTIPLPPPTTTTDKDLHSKEASHEDREEPPADQGGEEESPTSTQEKPKKPDKILPCPRCNSMDTKFCYYNNYNVNQPRHFCKNCHRYWTAGGTMRNVPVGAGRRKNKNSAAAASAAAASQFRHLTFPDARSDVHQPNAATVLSFGSSDMPLCESMASVLNLADKTMKNCQQNEKIIPFSCGVDENLSSGVPSLAAAPPDDGTRANLQEPKMQSSHRIPAPVPCFNGAPWPYPWSPAALCASTFSVPLYPATVYWGCPCPCPVPPPNWSIPWSSPAAPASPSATCDPAPPNSPSLGKHSRDEEAIQHRNSEGVDADQRQGKQERCLWVPKTLRIDNPDEAAKSSIWAMIGIKDDKTDETCGRRLFKAFQSEAEVKDQRRETSKAMHANPAALSRSLSFQESTVE